MVRGMKLLVVAMIPFVMHTEASEVPTIVNIVNFVRGTEPRYPDRDLLEPVRNEIELNTSNNLPNTFLLQYDALLRDDMVEAVKTADKSLTEYGVWFEMCRQLVEKCGIEWRGRKGWDWEWFVNPGFLMAYEPEQRERICDEVFRLFRERFGAYPKVVGSWLIDAHSMEYMSRKYGIDAFCICREQVATDAYGLHGGYANGCYYPSKINALSPAVDSRNAIPVPVFRMLTPDPIYNYGACRYAKIGSVTNHLWNTCTMEPISAAGISPDIVDWYFRVYTGPGRLGFSYMQTGQENSFSWTSIAKGLPYQIGKIVEMRDRKKVIVETLGDSGRRFKKNNGNIPQTLVALEDWAGNGYRSIWYNSKHYRANLIFDGRNLAFRDIHVFRDDFAERYLHLPCLKWHCSYLTPPVVDGAEFAGDGNSGTADFGGEFTTLDVSAPDSKTLVVSAIRKDSAKLRLSFCEESIMIDFGQSAERNWATARLHFRGYGPFFKNLDFPPGRITMEYGGYRYQISYEGDLKPSHHGWTLHPIKGKASLDFAGR